MKIGLTYDLQMDPTDEHQAEFDPPATLDALRASLEALGHTVILLGNARQLLTASQLLDAVELVFNIAEGDQGRCREAWVPMLLELRGVPYVGSDALALMLGLDKAMSKRLAAAAGLLTPRWISVAHPAALPSPFPLVFPVIVKPRFEGSGRGIDAGAVVRTPEALAARLEWLFARCEQPMLVEEFIAAGELTVCVIGNAPPIAYPAIQRPLDPATRLSCHVITPACPATERWRGADRPAPSRWDTPLSLDVALDAEARRIALAMFNALGCRDMARVDLRVDERGQVYFLEINPLPSFDPSGSFGLLAEYLGTTYTELIGRVLEAALRRVKSAEMAAR